MCEQLYSDGTFNTSIWDDTVEITTVQQIKCKGVNVLYMLNDVETKNKKRFQLYQIVIITKS